MNSNEPRKDRLIPKSVVDLKRRVNEAANVELTREQASISYSQFYRYATCPKSWELAYVQKLRSKKPSIHTVFGTSFHETLQHYLHVLFEDSVKAAEAIDTDQYLEQRMIANYSKELQQNENEHFSTLQELREFKQDGVAILDWIKRRRRAFFGPKGYELLGIEVPLYLPVDSSVNPNVNFLAYVDLVLYDKVFGRVRIIDIKTSTRGWKDKDKKDPIKKSQVMLYKHYFSKQFNVPHEDIEVEYFIVKRKLYEESEFPQQRVQTFTPAQGRVTMNKAFKWITDFIATSFNADGTYNKSIEYAAISGPDGTNCKFCEFKDRPDLCPANKRIETLSSESGDD